MVVLSLMYPAGARFDEDYYFNTHIPLVQDRLGARGPSDVRILRGVSGAGGDGPAYRMVALLTFPSTDDVEYVLTGEHSAEVLGDIANFTDGQPTVQISEVAA